MKFDTFLVSPRWEILQIIAENPSSPLEISKKINTTVSYVSQQLKLLEAAGIIKKEKTGSIEKGQPRNVFSLTKDINYIISLSKDVQLKSPMDLTERQKIVLKIWLIENDSVRYSIEKTFWKIEEFLPEISAIFVFIQKNSVKIFIASDSQKIKQKIELSLRHFPEKIDVEIIETSKITKLPTGIITLYFSQKTKEEQLKGGLNYK
jgi:predicted transcriptional regulator